ncbi:MAG: tetratricopeptide repeat protein [Treponemataceae bacterium]|nr:MAG: tetratricopeptide repeat protein [Treponemataceae bacterium]
MPGLKQLRQFSEDVSKIGNEPEIRKAKGEPFVPYRVPKGVSDKDDSDAFIGGLPSRENNSANKESVDGGESPKNAETVGLSDIFEDPDLVGFFNGTQDELPEPQPINTAAAKPSVPESAVLPTEDDSGGLPDIDGLDDFLDEALTPPSAEDANAQQQPAAQPEKPGEPQASQPPSEPTAKPDEQPESPSADGGLNLDDINFDDIDFEALEKTGDEPDDAALNFDELDKFLAESLAPPSAEDANAQQQPAAQPEKPEEPQASQPPSEPTAKPDEQPESPSADGGLNLDDINFDDIDFEALEKTGDEPDDAALNFDELDKFLTESLIPSAEKTDAAEKPAEPPPADDVSGLDDEDSETPETAGDEPEADSGGLESPGEQPEAPEAEGAAEPGELPETGETDDGLNLDDIDVDDIDFETPEKTGDEPDDAALNFDELDKFLTESLIPSAEKTDAAEKPAEPPPADDVSGLDDEDSETPETAGDEPEADSGGLESPGEQQEAPEAEGAAESGEPPETGETDGGLNLDDIDFDNIDFETPETAGDEPEADSGGLESPGEQPEAPEAEGAAESGEPPETGETDDDLSLDDIDFDNIDFETPETAGDEPEADSGGLESPGEQPETPEAEGAAESGEQPETGETGDAATGELPPGGDFDGADFSDNEISTDDGMEPPSESPAESASPEEFGTDAGGADVPDEDADDIFETDFAPPKNTEGAEDDEFSDVEMSGEHPGGFADFDIPGFSETETGGLEPTAQRGKMDVSAREKNTLTDAEYDLFKKHLALYPLNLRIAVEELITGDEFSDDVVFQIIQRIVKKTPARQLANQIQKLTDKAIPVPRDFERRTAQEYETYKQSLEYQFKNRILPAGIIALIAGLLIFLLYLFARHVIYMPLKAESLYKEGYTLLQNDMYEQSEDKFDQALLYRQRKKWFYTYARGYRDKKQYERAGNMYRQILARFKHEKQAGMEYARMELYDRANYERAEEIIRREVLDYHGNDSDGMLLLGDILLEWGTEENPAKLEDAREIYATLIQLYGPTNEYLSRMMRYFIRKDNLAEVLPLKERFYNQKKKMPLSAQDLIELSGYLRGKLFGPLLPSEEYMRPLIQDVRELLEMAVKAAPDVPEASYNYGQYFLNTRMFEQAKRFLEGALDLFERAPVQNHRRILKKINAYRLLGEIHFDEKDYLRAEELFNRGLSEFETEQRSSGLKSNADVGKLYGDAGNIEYFISGDMDEAFRNYVKSIENNNDTPSLRYRVGYIQYARQNYADALGSFIKTADQKSDDTHTLLALGNTLSFRGDNFAAESYYGRLLETLKLEMAKRSILLPQIRDDHHEIVDLYMHASNNLGVTLHRISAQRGDSARNAEALVNLSESIRAYDALTRNPQSMVRLEGGNLAQQNFSYVTRPIPGYSPEIYTEIPRVLYGEKIPAP